MLFVGLALFIGIWAIMSFKQKISITPTPGSNSFLVTGGPFAYIRHPLYFALLTGSFGLMIAYPTIPRGIALVMLAVILHIKVTYEEKMLASRFNGYEKYKQNTGALFPKIRSKNPTKLEQQSNSENAEKTEE
jgi:protein-S-isoprenylcysteine O-methyltransferase Ste14